MISFDDLNFDLGDMDVDDITKKASARKALAGVYFKITDRLISNVSHDFGKALTDPFQIGREYQTRD